MLPFKAILLNLLSVGAAYGLMVLVFQKGVGNELFGLRETQAVTTWVPLFLFAVLFGLSMDYHVFLLSRIRERYLRTGDNEEAVAYAVATTARVITGAALIIIVVFAGFASGDLVETQQVGFGVGIALLIDATIVRCVLVPASMKLLGRWNWYLPVLASAGSPTRTSSTRAPDAGRPQSLPERITPQMSHRPKMPESTKPTNDSRWRPITCGPSAASAPTIDDPTSPPATTTPTTMRFTAW